MPNFTLPGFNYLGPGNKLDSGKPRNKADKIAQQHDYEYDSAKTSQDVFDSDWNAIKSFAKNSLVDFNPVSRFGSTIGAIGLGAKTAVERIKGESIYPSQSSMAQKREADSTTDDVSKRMAVEGPAGPSSVPLPSGTEIPGATAATTGPGSSGAAAGRTHFYSGGPVQATEYTELEFSKVYRWHTEAFLPAYRKVAANDAVQDLNYIQFKPGSAIRVPVEFLWTYLSEGEFESLKNFTLVTCESVHAHVSSVGVRMPFVTNEAASVTANATAQIPIYKIKPEFSEFNLLQYDTTQLTDTRSKMHGTSLDSLPVSATYTENFQNISSRNTSRQLKLDAILRIFSPVTFNSTGAVAQRNDPLLGMPSFHEWKEDVLNGSSAIGPLWNYEYKPMNNVVWHNATNFPLLSQSINPVSNTFTAQATPIGVGKTNIMLGQGEYETPNTVNATAVNEAQGIIVADKNNIVWATKLIEDPSIQLHQKEFQSKNQPAFIIGMDFLRNSDGTLLNANWELVWHFKIKLRCYLKTPAQYPLLASHRYSMGNFPPYNIGSLGRAGQQGVNWVGNSGSHLVSDGLVGYSTTPWWCKPEFRIESRVVATSKKEEEELSNKKKRIV